MLRSPAPEPVEMFKPRRNFVEERIRELKQVHGFSIELLSELSGVCEDLIHDFLEGRFVSKEVAIGLSHALWGARKSWKDVVEIDEVPEFNQDQKVILASIVANEKRKKEKSEYAYKTLIKEIGIKRTRLSNFMNNGEGTLQTVFLLSSFMYKTGHMLEKLAVALGYKIWRFKLDLEIPAEIETTDEVIEYVKQNYSQELDDLDVELDKILKHRVNLGLSKGCVQIKIAIPPEDTVVLKSAFDRGDFANSKVTGLRVERDSTKTKWLAFSICCLAVALVLSAAILLFRPIWSGNVDSLVSPATPKNVIVHSTGRFEITSSDQAGDPRPADFELTVQNYSGEPILLPNQIELDVAEFDAHCKPIIFYYDDEQDPILAAGEKGKFQFHSNNIHTASIDDIFFENHTGVDAKRRPLTVHISQAKHGRHLFSKDVYVWVYSRD